MSEPKTLSEVLSSLPEEERIILVMHYLRSMSPSEIAQKLGVPERSVTAVIAIGKARLSKTLVYKPLFSISYIRSKCEILLLLQNTLRFISLRSLQMAAMKPRTGDGPMEVTKEARSLVMRIPLEGGGRLVVEMNAEEANNLSAALHAAVSLVKK